MYALSRSFLSITRSAGTFRFTRAAFATATGSKEHLDGLIKGKKVVVFMKGTPDEPRCGFSNNVMQILKFHGVNEFESFNVLEDQDVREGIKKYSNWPTIPQVYIDGEFVGGFDIMLEMHKNGELIDELQKVGIRSELLDNPDKKA